MPFPLLTIRYDPASLIIVAIQKSGSTTLIFTFLSLVGFPIDDGKPRRFLRSANSKELMAERGLIMQEMDADGIKKLRADFPNYTFVTVMRDPVQRLLSGYFNKINRFCRKYAPTVYAWGKFRRLLSGPKKWDDVNEGNRHMRRFVTLEKFVKALEDKGTTWDVHFAPQSHMNGMAVIKYDKVLRLETLNTDLLNLLADQGLSQASLERVKTMPRLNKTASSEKEGQDLLTSDLRDRIATLYRDDYAQLDS